MQEHSMSIARPEMNLTRTGARFAATCALLIAATLWTSCGNSHAAPDVDYFMPDHVLEIAIEIPASDWDALRRQARDVFGTLGGADCLSEPFGSPFTYFDATVTVDGERREHVGLRKKGFLGSLDADKPSLKIKFDEFVVGQELFGTQRMTLNNSLQDPAYVNQCLAFDLFARGGVPAPRCNFAHVTLNGVDMGIYVHVENVKKPFLREHFADDEGQLYEGTLSDFRAGWDGSFEQKTNRDIPYDRSDIAAVEAALAPGAPAAALEGVIDMDGFLDQWALEVLVEHWDGYAGNTNNYFIYGDPTDGLLHFIPWGVDQTFGQQDGEVAMERPARPTYTIGAIARHLWDTADGRARYEARLREHLSATWDAARMESELDRMAALIRPYMQPRDMERGFENAIELRRDYMRTRETRLLAALDAPYTPDAPRDSFCFLPIGDVTATFDTLYGMAAGDNAFAHPGTLDATFAGAPVAFTMVGSLGGPDDNDPSAAVVGVIGLRADGIANVVAVLLPQDELSSGAIVPLDLNRATGLVLQVDTRVMGAEPTIVALIGNGSVTFEQAEATEGAPIVGSLRGQLFSSFF